jgi:hypothetical protein
MGYTVFNLEHDDNGNTRSGLTLEAAFDKLLTSAGCKYAFVRKVGTMWLELETGRDWPLPAADNFIYESDAVDDDAAKKAIMLAAIKNMWGTWCVYSDAEFKAHDPAFDCEMEIHQAMLDGKQLF